MTYIVGCYRFKNLPRILWVELARMLFENGIWTVADVGVDLYTICRSSHFSYFI